MLHILVTWGTIMKSFTVLCFTVLLQQACSQCLPATAYCLTPPAVEVLPSLPLPACALPPGLPELLPALAPLLATTISSSLAATLPPLLEAALPTVLTSALAAAAPLLAALPAAPCLPPPACLPASCAPAPILYASLSPTPTCIYV